MEKLFDVALWLYFLLACRRKFGRLSVICSLPGEEKGTSQEDSSSCHHIAIMNAVHFKSVELVDFDKVLGTTSTEVSSVALGGRILACSDEWFAPASDLLKVSSLAQECV